MVGALFLVHWGGVRLHYGWGDYPSERLFRYS